MTSPVNQSESGSAPQNGELGLKYLWAEWELIQKKIDSVSTFPFTVKTWTVALTGALLGLAKGLETTSPLILLAALIPLVFWAIEAKHDHVRDALSKRAQLLEILIAKQLKELNTFDKNFLGSATRIPGVALTLSGETNSLKREHLMFSLPEGKTWWNWIICRNITILGLRVSLQWADKGFYLFQCVVALFVGAWLAWFSPPKPKSEQSVPEGIKPGVRQLPPQQREKNWI